MNSKRLVIHDSPEKGSNGVFSYEVFSYENSETRLDGPFYISTLGNEFYNIGRTVIGISSAGKILLKESNPNG